MKSCSRKIGYGDPLNNRFIKSDMLSGAVFLSYTATMTTTIIVMMIFLLTVNNVPTNEYGMQHWAVDFRSEHIWIQFSNLGFDENF